MRASTSPVTLLVGMLLVPVTPVMAQSFGIEMRMGVTYLRAYGGGGAGPDVGIAVRLPGRIFGARPRVGLAVSAADLPLVGAVGPFVDGDHRRLQLVVGDVGFEWPVTTRVRAHVAGVLGRVESVVPSFLVVTAAGARPANHAGEARGMVAGVEAGVRLALVPGLDLIVRLPYDPQAGVKETCTSEAAFVGYTVVIRELPAASIHLKVIHEYGGDPYGDERVALEETLVVGGTP